MYTLQTPEISSLGPGDLPAQNHGATTRGGGPRRHSMLDKLEMVNLAPLERVHLSERLYINGVVRWRG